MALFFVIVFLTCLIFIMLHFLTRDSITTYSMCGLLISSLSWVVQDSLVSHVHIVLQTSKQDCDADGTSQGT